MYFPRKEDMLFELGVLSTDAAVRTAREMLAKPHELGAIIANVLNSPENTMRANPPELIIEAIPNRAVVGDRSTTPDPAVA